MPVRPRSPTSRALGPRTRRLAEWAASKPLAVLVLLLVAGAAAAAITITYSTSSTLTTSVAAVPVQFEAGADAGPSALGSFVTSYAISTNRTYVTATVKGVPEATLDVDSFLRLHNVDSAARTVSLSSAQLSNAYVSAYTLRVYDGGGVLRGTLTLTDASPAASFTMPAGETWRARLTLTLLSGAGADNVALSPAVSMSVT